MKVKFQYGLAGYTGKADGLIYCYNRKSGKVYTRRKVQPRTQLTIIKWVQ